MTTTSTRQPDSLPGLRRAGPTDAEAVRALTRAAYAEWVPVIGREPRPMEADYARAIRDHRVDLVEVGGEVVGLIEVVAEPDCLLIVNVAVTPARRGQGLGLGLLRHAEAVAIEAGLPRIRLYTNRLMATNVARYRRLGYVVDREERNAFGTVIHMSKAVPAP